MVVELALVGVSIGLSILAGQLLKGRQKPIADDKPTAVATRGAYIPRLIGRRRIGYVFGWAGSRAKRKERVKAGKGSFLSPKQDVWTEDGMHLLCVGPAFKLWEIEQNGTPILKGPITSDSHPSGSTIDLGSEGSFRIFWGERNQPVNTYLGSASRVGVESAWPSVCYIEWRSKRLGTSPTWPQMTYVLETRPSTTLLTLSNGYIEPTRVLSATAYPVVSHVSGIAGVGYWVVDGYHKNDFFPDQVISVQGDTGLGVDTDYTVLSVSQIGDGGGVPYQTRIYLTTTLSGSANGDGDIYPYDQFQDDGWNAAHAIAETLFMARPLGLALPQEDWDIDSLEDLGVLLSEQANQERIPFSFQLEGGQDAQALMAAAMQDLGFLISTNPRTGLLTFLPIREAVGTLANVTEGALVRRPERETRVGPMGASTRIVFSFPDESNYFREMTIGTDDDGKSRRLAFDKADTIAIDTTSDFTAAGKIAQRREQEQMAGGAAFTLSCGRATRALMPGQAVTVDGFDQVLRVTAVSGDSISQMTTLKLMNDAYGQPASSFAPPQGNTGSGGSVVEPDLDVDIVEVPEILTGAGGPLTVLVLALRAHATIEGHNLNISRDGSTYTLYGLDETILTGGLLDDDLDPLLYQAQGPTITVDGPDISTVLDLSSDDAGWQGGRQMAVFIDATGLAEIAFLKKVTALGGDSYRLDGLLRARYDTRPLTILAGARVYILQNDDGLPIQDPLLAPQEDLYVKAEPIGIGQLPLSEIEAVVLELYGKGIRPVPPGAPYLDTGADTVGVGTIGWLPHAYKATGASPADDLLIQWAYSTPQSLGTGAGQFAAGSVVTDPAPEGDFYVEILDASDVVVRTLTTSTPSYTYVRADRLADFSASEPALFKVRVTQIRGGYSSDTAISTITRTS